MKVVRETHNESGLYCKIEQSKVADKHNFNTNCRMIRQTKLSSTQQISLLVCINRTHTKQNPRQRECAVKTEHTSYLGSQHVMRDKVFNLRYLLHYPNSNSHICAIKREKGLKLKLLTVCLSRLHSNSLENFWDANSLFRCFSSPPVWCQSLDLFSMSPLEIHLVLFASVSNPTRELKVTDKWAVNFVNSKWKSKV